MCFIVRLFRSLRSLGLEEEVSSCEEEDGIGALATSSRPRSTSRGLQLLYIAIANKRTFCTAFKLRTSLSFFFFYKHPLYITVWASCFFDRSVFIVLN